MEYIENAACQKGKAIIRMSGESDVRDIMPVSFPYLAYLYLIEQLSLSHARDLQKYQRPVCPVHPF